MLIKPSETVFLDFIDYHTELNFSVPARRWLFDYLDSHCEDGWVFDEAVVKEKCQEFTAEELTLEYGERYSRQNEFIYEDIFEDEFETEIEFDEETLDEICANLRSLEYVVERLENGNFIVVDSYINEEIVAIVRC